MSVIPFRRAADPDIADLVGGEEPPPMGENDPPDGGHTEWLRKAYSHAVRCVAHLQRALDLLDDGPLDDEPMTDGLFCDDEVGPLTGYDDDAGRRALMRSYARMVGMRRIFDRGYPSGH